MAVTTYGVNDALSNRLQAKSLSYEVTKGLEIAPLIGTGPNSIIQQKTEFKDKGDRITFGLRGRLTGDGVTENQVLEGNEEGLATFSDTLFINELAHAVRVKGEDGIDQQRVLFNMRDEGKAALADWYSERTSLAFFLQMAGYTAPTITYREQVVATSLVRTGLNATIAPSASKRLYGNSLASDQAVGAASTATMTLDLVLKAKEKARLANPRIRPVRVNGADKYVMYLHPTQVVDLQLEAQATGSISWADIQLAALRGGEISNNPIYTGAVGEYMGVVLRENEDVPTGVHSVNNTEEPNVRRAILMGAQAGVIGFSSKFDKTTPYKWVEEEFDYGRELGMSVQSLYGLKKTQFNGTDFGVITVSTYAVAHT